MKLSQKPAKPTNKHLIDAHSVLSRTIDSAGSFFDAFEKLRAVRNAKGAPTDHEQDLLRAALLFAAAGLDAMVKQLVRDTLEHVQKVDAGAHQQFADFVQARLVRSPPVDVKLLVQSLMADKPREHLRAELVRELTSSSLQSKDQLLKVAAYFALRPEQLTTDIGKLKDVFDARNQIAHDMDILFRQVNRSRRSRSLSEMRDHAIFVLNVSRNFYEKVAAKVLSA